MRYTGYRSLLTCAESGLCWVNVVAAFFLIWGYFIIHLVIFTPWGVTNCQKCFPKKITMRPGLSKILFRIAPDLIHQELPAYIRPPVNTQGRDQPCPLLLIALGCTTLHTAHSQPRAQGPAAGYSILNTEYRVPDRVLDGRSAPLIGDTILCGRRGRQALWLLHGWR